MLFIINTLNKRIVAALLCLPLLLNCTPSNKISGNIASDFEQMLTMAKDLSESTDEQFLHLHARSKLGLTDEESVKLIELKKHLEANKVKAMHFAASEERLSASFILIAPENYTANGTWSYQYSTDGYTEETIVDSITKALAANDRAFIHVCERADTDNWFVCFNRS